MDNHTASQLISVLKPRPCGPLSVFIIEGALAAQYMLPDESMEVWMACIHIALIFACFSTALEIAGILMSKTNKSFFLIDDYSNLMVYIAGNAVLLGLVIKTFQNALKSDSSTTCVLQMGGAFLLGFGFFASLSLVLFGTRLRMMLMRQ